LNPVRNKICKHVYEEATIKEAIKLNPRTKCPYLGCGNKQPVKLDDFAKDDDLRHKIDIARTQQCEQEENEQANYEDSD
jgi:SUMO ligase MMS21 Smc5/6 complex component